MHELVKDAQSGDCFVFHCTSFRIRLCGRTARLTSSVIVSGHGSQVLAPPDHVEEIDGYDEGKRILRARNSVVADVPCPVIWPCDIQGFMDHDETIQVVSYILDDVSIPSPIPSLVLTLMPRRTSREF